MLSARAASTFALASPSRKREAHRRTRMVIGACGLVWSKQRHNLHEMPHCAPDTPASHAMASALSSQHHDQSSSDTEQTDISARQKTPTPFPQLSQLGCKPQGAPGMSSGATSGI